MYPMDYDVLLVMTTSRPSAMSPPFDHQSPVLESTEFLPFTFTQAYGRKIQPCTVDRISSSPGSLGNIAYIKHIRKELHENYRRNRSLISTHSPPFSSGPLSCNSNLDPWLAKRNPDPSLYIVAGGVRRIQERKER